MSVFSHLAPAGVWQIFEIICATPHPSGKEELLAEKLTQIAEKGGLSVRRDAFGNMLIEKAPSPGMEDRPVFLLQAHLDMVPQKAPGLEFDFHKDPLPVAVEGNKVSCQHKTTLGADDGIGVALALDLLLDKEFPSGKMAAVFTREEEIGLNGARALPPEFLQGDYLINLDCTEDFICAGCAGGVETCGTFLPEYTLPRKENSFSISVRGLAGGHSGEEIHKKRGNAHKFLAALLRDLGGKVEIASLLGGSVANAISRESEGIIVTALPEEELRSFADGFAEKLRPLFHAEKEFGFTVTACPLPEKVWKEDFQRTFLELISGLPDGVLEFSELNATKWSCNLGFIREEKDGKITIGLHPRSFDDAQWQRLSREIGEMIRKAGGIPREFSPYPGWKYDPDSPLITAAVKSYEELTGKLLAVTTIHAGLETGLFCEKNPALKLLAIGPSLHELHTTEEWLDAESVLRSAQWLRKIIASFGKGNL